MPNVKDRISIETYDCPQTGKRRFEVWIDLRTLPCQFRTCPAEVKGAFYAIPVASEAAGNECVKVLFKLIEWSQAEGARQ